MLVLLAQSLGKYTNDAAGAKTLGLAGGYGFRVTTLGPIGIWSLNSVDIGAKQLSSINTDVVAMFKITGDSAKTRLFGGLVAGPNTDFVSATGDNFLTYLNGAVGGILQVQFPNYLGLAVAGKYKFSTDGDNLFEDGFQTGLWLTKNF